MSRKGRQYQAFGHPDSAAGERGILVLTLGEQEYSGRAVTLCVRDLIDRHPTQSI